jgi:ribose transport system permease protein
MNESARQVKTASEKAPSRVGQFFKMSWRKANFVYINLFIFLIYVFCALKSFNWGLVTNILYSSVTIGITAIGMALIIINGDIDLSAGSVFALDAGLSALVYNGLYASTGKNAGLAFFVTLLFALFFGLFLGAVNGLFVGYCRMPAFIVTLATMLIYRSLIVYTLSSQPNHPSTFRLSGYGSQGDPLYALGSLSFASVSLIGILFILLVLLFYFLSTKTKFGRKIYAVGSNAKAASLIGIHVPSIKFLVFAIEGLLIGFAAFLQLGIRGNIDPSAAGSSYELYAIASNVLGGISMAGGSGNLIGVLFGSLAFQTIDKIIAALHLNANLNDTIKGIILLLAVIFQIFKFSPEKASRLLARLHLKYDPDRIVHLESARQEKKSKMERKARKKVLQILSDEKKDETAKKEESFAVLRKTEERKKALDIAYDAKVEKARLAKEEHEKKVAEKKKKEEEKLLSLSPKDVPPKDDKAKEKKKKGAQEKEALLQKKEMEEQQRKERLSEKADLLYAEFEKTK